MSGHADTIRRHADTIRDLERIISQDAETIGRYVKLVERKKAENQRLRDAALYARATLRGMLSDPNVTRSIDPRPEIEMLDRALAGEKEPDAMP